VAEFGRFLDVNVRGTLVVLRAVSAAMKAQSPRDTSSVERGVRGMAQRGAIVTMGSAQSMVAWPGMVQYTASKFAVLGISKNAGE
jgi:NAD(P)-dependent dehydrogenase (short-subunit alcohol dehydrogenase family)